MLGASVPQRQHHDRVWTEQHGFLPLERLVVESGSFIPGGMKRYSVDLRQRLLGATDASQSSAESARLFSVGTSTIACWYHQRATTGDLHAAPRPGRTPAIGLALAHA